MHDVHDAPALHAFVASLMPAFHLPSLGANLLVAEQIDAALAKHGLTRGDFYDTFALHVAQAYLAGRIDFDVADHAINNLFFFDDMVASDEVSFAFEVFQCFDDGEYFHAGDPADVVPELKYTLPQLRETFKTYGIELPA